MLERISIFFFLLGKKKDSWVETLIWFGNVSENLKRRILIILILFEEFHSRPADLDRRNQKRLTKEIDKTTETCVLAF